MLERIAVVVLTYNESPNLERTLSRLGWARDIVIVDSLSSDETPEIARKHPNVRFFQRTFATHAAQWQYAISETGIEAEWILALDADYVLSEELVEELRRLEPPPGIAGYAARFVYCIDGRPLRATLYPPVTVLYRRKGARYEQDGHTQRIVVGGPVASLASVIYHDDRKSLAHWVAAQNRYAKIEADRMASPDWRPRGFADRLRGARVVAPVAVLFYCLFVRGLILDGRDGVFYSLQRAFAELLLSLYLVRNDLDRLARVT